MQLALSAEASETLKSLNVLPYTSEKARELFYMPQNTEAWLHERQIRCTASDIAMVAGLSRYGDTSTVLRNKFNPSPATEAMKLGLQYEPILASGYETLLKEKHKENVEFIKAGLLISKTHPYLAASLDYFQLKPEPCIVEIKCWSNLPEQISPDAEAQVIMQLALAVDSDVIDWGGGTPKAVVVAGNPNTNELLITSIEWDEDTQNRWYETLLPKAYMFYVHGVLPKLAPLIQLNSNAALPSARADIGNEEPQTPAHQSPCFDMDVDDCTPIISPQFKEKKTVFRSKSGRFGVLDEVKEDGTGYITWDGEKQTKRVLTNLDAVVVCPKPREQWVNPTKVGQRVLVCAGINTYVGLKGTITKIAANKCSVEVQQPSEVEIITNISVKYLHVLHEKPSDSGGGSHFVPTSVEINIADAEGWVQEYQMSNNVDLVLHKTNNTCSKDFLAKTLHELINRQQTKEAEGVDALMTLQIN